MLSSEGRINSTPSDTRVRGTRLIYARIFPRTLDSATFLTLSSTDGPACNTPARFPPVPVTVPVTIAIPFPLPFALLALKLLFLVIVLFIVV